MTLMGVLLQILGFLRVVIAFFLKLPIIGPWFDFISLLFSSGVARFGAGRSIASNLDKCTKPKKLLKLYEFEGCPFCRKVREVLCVLDLDAIIYPCPRESWDAYGIAKEGVFRTEVKKLGGKAQFPFLIDENNLDSDNKPLMMYESDEIIKYLFRKYGSNAKAPLIYNLASKTGVFTAFIGQMWRPLDEHGLHISSTAKPNIPPNYKLIEIYQYEPSPFCKRVREVLSCLQIPYISRSIAHGSPKRKLFKDKFSEYYSKWRQNIGNICVPLLFDPNTNTTMTESKDIVKYLYDNYTTPIDKKKEN